MDCSACLDAVSASLDGELGPAEASALAEHIGRCAECRATAEALDRQHRAFRLRPVEPVPDLTESILQSAAGDDLTSRRRARRRHSLLAAVAGTAVLLGIGGAVWATRPAGPAPMSAVAVRDARASAGQAGGVASVYLYLANDGGGDRVVAVTSPIADEVELHRTEVSQGIATMHNLHSLAVPRDAAADLEPGSTHIMLVGLHQELAPGDEITLTLHLERGDPIEVTAVVVDRAALQA